MEYIPKRRNLVLKAKLTANRKRPEHERRSPEVIEAEVDVIMADDAANGARRASEKKARRLAKDVAVYDRRRAEWRLQLSECNDFGDAMEISREMHFGWMFDGGSFGDDEQIYRETEWLWDTGIPFLKALEVMIGCSMAARGLAPGPLVDKASKMARDEFCDKLRERDLGHWADAYR